VIFCNESCRDTAAFFHKFECGTCLDFFYNRDVYEATRIILFTDPGKLIG